MHWIVRVNDGKNFYASMKRGIWALKSWASDGKNFLSYVNEHDTLWFLTNYKAGKKFIAVATFTEIRKRETGPLISLTATNEELGWTDGEWDTEIHFTNLYLIGDLEIQPNIKCQSSYIKATSVSTDINFDLEHKNIVRYSKVKQIS